jgi:hypothetical protein
MPPNNVDTLPHIVASTAASIAASIADGRRDAKIDIATLKTHRSSSQTIAASPTFNIAQRSTIIASSTRNLAHRSNIVARRSIVVAHPTSIAAHRSNIPDHHSNIFAHRSSPQSQHSLSKRHIVLSAPDKPMPAAHRRHTGVIIAAASPLITAYNTDQHPRAADHRRYRRGP